MQPSNDEIYSPLEGTWTRMTKKDFNRFLNHQRFYFEDFTKPSPRIATVLKSDTVSQCLKTLIEGKVHSAPILEDGTSLKPIGIASMKNLINIFLSKFNEDDFTDLQKLECKKNELANKSLESLLENFKAYDPPYFLPLGATLLDAVYLMDERTDSVIICDEKNMRIANVITQSKFIDIITTMLDFLPESLKSIRELNIGFKEVFTVGENSKIIEGFKLMNKKNITGVGVVDKEGRLIGSLSVNDLKAIGSDMKNLPSLVVSVKDFLKQVDRTSLKPEYKPSPLQEEIFGSKKNPDNPDIIHVNEEATLARVIKMMDFYRVHRIYITNSEMKPIGVITSSDVIREPA